MNYETLYLILVEQIICLYKIQILERKFIKKFKKSYRLLVGSIFSLFYI